MPKNNQAQPNPVKVDLRNIPPMKCFCGANTFQKKYNLHYISPILCGDPKGMTAEVFMFECSLCKTLWPKATTLDEVNRRYQKLPPDIKTRIDQIKADFKAAKEKAASNIQFANFGTDKK